MPDEIKKDMTFGELIKKYPETAEVLLKHGMHCIGCHMAASETIEQGAKSHGMSDEDIEKMIGEMNSMLEGSKDEPDKG